VRTFARKSAPALILASPALAAIVLTSSWSRPSAAQTTFAAPYDGWFTTVATARSSGGTSLVVNGVGSLPNPATFYRLTIANASTGIPYVHLKVTGVNAGTNMLTIAGTLDGTTDPATIPVGDRAYISVNGGTIADLQAAVNAPSPA
jgi:hypothetical protein